MLGSFAHRLWTIAYFACWMLASGGACWLVVAVGWAVYGNRGIDDDVSLLGIPLGVAAGFVAARATRQRRGWHLLLMFVGPVLAAIGGGCAVMMFAAARAKRGDGPFTGLGEALVGLLGIAVSALGVLWLTAGATGLMATRTAAGGGAHQIPGRT